MFSSRTSLLALALALPSLVSAHGYVSQVSIDGKSYQGNPPGAAGGSSPIRQVESVEPVKGTDNPSLSCGNGAKPASESADAMPGSSVSIQWVGGGGAHWPHEVGPLMTYMASCGSSSCESFDSLNAKWFKIDEAGLTDGTTWAQKAIQQGSPVSVSLPSDLAAGSYLLRHEIIGLHNAMSEGGAEFYPSCTQLKVGGSDSGSPPSNDLVSLPGAYKDTDPGILFDAYSGGDKSYIFPGPPVVKMGAESAGSGSTRRALRFARDL